MARNSTRKGREFKDKVEIRILIHIEKMERKAIEVNDKQMTEMVEKNEEIDKQETMMTKKNSCDKSREQINFYRNQVINQLWMVLSFLTGCIVRNLYPMWYRIMKRLWSKTGRELIKEKRRIITERLRKRVQAEQQNQTQKRRTIWWEIIKCNNCNCTDVT